jgi:hypothetical protein
MFKDEINKFNLIKKTKFLLRKPNLTETGKKKLETTLVILKIKINLIERIKKNVGG